MKISEQIRQSSICTSLSEHFYKITKPYRREFGSAFTLYMTDKKNPSLGIKAFSAICIGVLINNSLHIWEGDESFVEKLKTKHIVERVFVYFEEDLQRIRLIHARDQRILNIEHSKITESFKNIFNFTVISSENSARVFGLKKIKESLVNKTFKGSEIEISYGRSEKLNSETFYAKIPYIDEENSEEGIRHIKFVMSDLELSLPNLKGWNFKKVRTLNIGDYIYIIRDPEKAKWKVVNIEQNPYSNKTGYEHIKTKDILTIVNDLGISKKVYAKHVKKIEIENDNKENIERIQTPNTVSSSLTSALEEIFDEDVF